MSFYFVYKPENIAKIWKYPTTITTPGVTTFVLKTLFGMAPKAFNMYTLDTSGIYQIPKPGSHVAPHNRIDYLTYTSFHKHLFGDGLSAFFQTFTAALMRLIESMNIESEWAEFPDIMDFWLPPMTASLSETIAGPILECVNPNFNHDLLRYFWYVHPLMKSLPRCCIPEAYRLRKTLIRDMKQWRAIAMARFKEDDVNEEGGSDPWWALHLWESVRNSWQRWIIGMTIRLHPQILGYYGGQFPFLQWRSN